MNDRQYLGRDTKYQFANPDEVKLDIIPNPQVGMAYIARFTIPEFTSLCPQTGQPDFATLIIDYQPSGHLLESKALKLWMFAFRNHGAFHEDVTVGIGARFYEEVRPCWLRIAGFWYPRGGIPIDVIWEAGEILGNAKPLGLDIKPYLGRV
jgi:7-cyano-7-deazaguanine reductase